jgi:hypothetical protein
MTGNANVPVAPPDDADARFAACLADMAAHLDDPQLGAEYRAFLDDDPETQRALFDLAEAMAANPGPLPGTLLWAAWCPVLLLAAVLLVRFLL